MTFDTYMAWVGWLTGLPYVRRRRPGRAAAGGSK